MFTYFKNQRFPLNRLVLARFLHITTAGTPNPNSLKFLPGRPVTGTGEETMDISSVKYASVSPLAERLFEIDGVKRVFYGKDYIAVTKTDELQWSNDFKEQIMGEIT